MFTTHERIAGFAPLAGLSQDYLDLLTSAATPVSYGKHVRLIFQDEPAIGCWLVLEGGIAIDSLMLGHDHEVVAVAGPGEIVGWSWAVPPYRWHLGAVTLTPVRALLLDTGYLRTLMANDPDFDLVITTAMRAVASARAEAVEARFAARFHPDRR